MAEEDIWRYLLIELLPEKPLQDELLVDEVTWRSYIRSSLLKLHGIFGSAIEVEFIAIKGARALIRVQKEDLQRFKSSLLMYTADLSILGHERQAIIKFVDASSSTRL